MLEAENEVIYSQICIQADIVENSLNELFDLWHETEDNAKTNLKSSYKDPKYFCCCFV